jgi:hypothetical protein
LGWIVVGVDGGGDGVALEGDGVKEGVFDPWIGWLEEGCHGCFFNAGAWWYVGAGWCQRLFTSSHLENHRINCEVTD